jgi:Uma2 family endonuclease
MSSVATPPAKLDDPYADKILADLESLHLISSDGVPMESGWHVKNMTLLINQIEHHFRDRDDFYVGGNMFIYYSPQQARNRDFRGPDFFFVNDVNRYPLRKYWVVWEENLTTPDVVIELSSESTKDEDHGPKFRIYRDTLRVGNYFIYDPETRLLEGWRLEKGKKYVPIRPDSDGRLLSDKLDLTLGTWEGSYTRYADTWLRFFDRSGAVVPTSDESAEAEAARAKAAARAATDETARAEAEKQRADVEHQRADALAAELAHLKDQLAKGAQP